VSREGQGNCWALLSMSGHELAVREGGQSSRVKTREKSAAKTRLGVEAETILADKKFEVHDFPVTEDQHFRQQGGM
jgi:hypothetical protein